MPRATWLDPQSDGLINPQIKSSLLGTVENASTHPTHSTHSTFRSRDSTLKITRKTLKFPQVQPSRKIFGLPAMKFCSFSMGRNRIFRPFEARRSTSSLALRLEARRPVNSNFRLNRKVVETGVFKSPFHPLTWGLIAQAPPRSGLGSLPAAASLHPVGSRPQHHQRVPPSTTGRRSHDHRRCLGQHPVKQMYFAMCWVSLRLWK